MLRNFFIIALRYMFRHRAYVFINIFGFAVGLACSILITLFILHELSYDRFYDKKDRIYRVYIDGKIGQQEMKVAYTPAPLARSFVNEIPGIEDAIRMENWGETVIKYNDKSFIEDGFALADSSFFMIFSLPLLQGDPKTVLARKHALVMTESTAHKYFGSENAVGKMLKVGTDTALWSVTGVCADVPENTHLEFNILGSFITSDRAEEPYWLNNSFSTYVLLAKGVSKEQTEANIIPVLMKHIGPEVEQYIGVTLDQFAQAGNRYKMYLQPLADIHLNPEIEQDFKSPNDKKYIYIFSIVALLILVIAMINYMNLSTARSANRAREVGMRKVLGSGRNQLISQFIAESVLTGFVALIFALLIVELLLPFFNNLIQIRLHIDYFHIWYTIPLLILLAILIGILAGSYPAFFLSSFKPIAVLAGVLKRGSKGSMLRSILVVLQLFISVSIILATIIIYRQVNFMLSKDLGFDDKNLLIISRVHALQNNLQTFIDEADKIPGVIKTSHATAIPCHTNNTNGYMIEGRTNDQLILMTTSWTDHQYLETLGMKLVEGRYFSADFASDSAACVINESAVKQFNLQKPIGTRFIRPGNTPEERIFTTVIGVVKDFHFTSLRSNIEPYVFLHAGNNNNWGYITIRMRPENKEQTLHAITGLWRNFTHNDPMQYQFMDEDFQSQYKEDLRTGSLSLVFSILAIFIASLGLFGLTSFTTEQRTHEIGIRKVQGASGVSILSLLSREVMLLVVIATAMAWPVTYYFMKNWLMNYYYRIRLSPLEFILSLLVVVVITLLTTGYRSYRAAQTNPAEALRYQ
jgi:putative ABC transport system permease protein